MSETTESRASASPQEMRTPSIQGRLPEGEASESFRTFRASLLAMPRNDDKEYAEIFAFNKDAILKALQTLGATEATVEYEGGGDEGQTDSAQVQPASLCLETHMVEIVDIWRDWDEQANALVIDLIPILSTLDDALVDLCDRAIVLSGNGSYQDGEGGQGILRIDVPNGVFKLEHTSFYIEEKQEEYEL